MIRRTRIIFVLFLLALSSVLVGFNTNMGSMFAKVSASGEYQPEDRLSDYAIDNRSVASYPEITMSDQQVSPSNASLLERTLSLNLTSPTIEADFDLTSSDAFLAIDGSSQSFVLRVNYTIYYPNGTVATAIPLTTTANSPMHFYILNPPMGTWRILAALIDTGETTAWIQAISYSNGAKWVTGLEKEQIHLISGQSLYLRIPLFSTDWFYLYVNKFAGADVQISLRQQGAYGSNYRSYTNYASEFFPSKSSTPGVFLLMITNKGSTDIFVEIVKNPGIRYTLGLDSGKTIRSRFQVDLDFFNLSVDQSYEWIAFDGAVIGNSMTARYLVIDPNSNIIFDGTSSSPTAFEEKLVSYPSRGTYFVAIFSSQFANATIKITSASSVSSIDFVQLDQNWSFAQSGQTFYLKILQSQRYFLFAATAFSPTNVRYALFNPSLALIWSWGPSNGLAFYPPTQPTVPFYILKITGQTNSSSLIHIRFEGLEDYQIQTPDCSNYGPRFQGDIIIANLSIRNSDYVLQHCGALGGTLYVALFDGGHSQKWSQTFSSAYQTSFQRWRKGYENPSSGNWLEVVIDSGSQAAAIEISTLQSHDESGYIVTPFQSLQTVEWNDVWQVRTYGVAVDSTKWFGIVSQLLSVNTSYATHPYVSLWVYNPNLAEGISGQTLDRNNQFRESFWPNPMSGTWLVVVVGMRWSLADPLNCSLSYISDADFHRDWPTNLNGTLASYSVVAQNTAFLIGSQSNSTISGFLFDEEKREIDFNASGPEGTSGFCVLTIPKQLAGRPFLVFVNNQPWIGILSKENDTHTSIYFSYPQGENQVTVIFGATIPELPSFLALPLFMMATLLVVIARKKKRQHFSSDRSSY